jgi:processive 1,2-diacylglycerol beta-glucosyltransferase
MRKIWILYTGVGDGHKNAGEAIKKELEARNIEVKIFDSAKYANPFVFELMRSLTVRMQKYLPMLYNYFYKTSNRKRKITDSDFFSKLAIRLYATKRLISLVQKEKPDLIISTFLINSRQISYIKKRGLCDIPSILVKTDHVCHNWFLDLQEYIDYFVVPDEMVKKEMVKRGVNEKKIFDFGIPVGSEFVSRAKTNHPKLRVLFFGGGGLGFETSLPYLKALQNNNNLEIKFISGKSQKLNRKAQSIASDNTKVLGFSSDIPKLLHWSDLVISKAGGITTTECINSGTPLVSILSFGGHEKENVSYVVSNNAGLWCNSPENLKRTIQQLEKDRTQIATMAKSCNKLAKTNATSDIVKLALDAMRPTNQKQ